MKVLEFYSGISRTGKSWKINGGPGKSWKSINACKKTLLFFLKNCPTIIFGFLLHIKRLLLNYCAFGRPGKIYLSPGEVLEKSWRIVSEKGYEPCLSPDINMVVLLRHTDFLYAVNVFVNNSSVFSLFKVLTFLDRTGSKLNYRLYGEYLFDILFAGGVLGMMSKQYRY